MSTLSGTCVGGKRRTLLDDLALQRLDLTVSRHSVQLTPELGERPRDPCSELIPALTHALDRIVAPLLHASLDLVELVCIRPACSRL